ncbi:MAG: hypothetical protein AAGD96_29060 [Chloroflexota bacterium]
MTFGQLSTLLSGFISDKWLLILGIGSFLLFLWSSDVPPFHLIANPIVISYQVVGEDGYTLNVRYRGQATYESGGDTTRFRVSPQWVQTVDDRIAEMDLIVSANAASADTERTLGYWRWENTISIEDDTEAAAIALQLEDVIDELQQDTGGDANP